MKERIFILISVMMLMTVQLTYGAENDKNSETDMSVDVLGIESSDETEEEIIDTEMIEQIEETHEITDPEVLDRMERMVSKYQGVSEPGEEIIQMIEESKSPNHMPVDVRINNSYLKSDVEAMIINERTYVPLRAICEAYNIMDIEWSEAYYKATITADGKEIMFLVNTNDLVVDEEVITMDSPTVIVDGRTLVPIRYVSELLGFNVEWDETYFSVLISHDTFPVNPDRLETRFYSYEELQTFSKLLLKEAGSVSYETMHGVASVVMNQYRHPEFENTIEGVIFAKNKTSAHFPPAHKEGFFDTVPNSYCVLAVKKVLRGENSVESCIYFNTSPFKNKTVYKVVDGVYFCY